MIQFPNCKINLGLNIVGKRPDGYHNLESILYPLPLYDVLEIIPAPDGIFQFHVTGLAIPGEVEQNLCVRAFRLLQDEFALPEVHMHLHKVIPLGSGLGGGSANGTFTLGMVNELFSLRLDAERLKSYARLLGSDCAFFVDNLPVFAFEKGDRFEPVDISLSGLFLAIVIPDIHVVTADAYRMAVPGVPVRSLKELIQFPVETWKDSLGNDFEKPVIARFPIIGEIKQQLYDSGAVYASMSGSGSAVFGIFHELPLPEDFPGCFFWSAGL
ncbi:MAG: 4-(cytidine 5'-diphospho)-2-C-methyl-D-erythritol kinase [Bacteroidetes bacterium]|nr:4-(cytidine 5'-diphospho)-2-C-methyl-D-erythritol kinase [Bacteroidota bacterium]